MIAPNNNLYAIFQTKFPNNRQDTLLLTSDNVRYSYEDAESASARLANCLCALGLQPGDRVSVQVEKSPLALWLYLACLRAGVVFHPLNSAYTASELAYFFDNAEPALVICAGSQERAVKPVARRAGVKQVLTLNVDGSGTLMDKAAECSAECGVVLRSVDDMAVLLYSSGTTGRPKGIVLSHGNLAANARVLCEAWGFTRSDRLLHALPIFHVHGLFVALGCVLLSGASMRWLPKFDAGTAVAYLNDCTVMMGVPTYYTRLLEQDGFGLESCRNMRLFISGSAPLLEETFDAFRTRTGHAILERYGMTETNMNTSNPLHGKRKAGTVGLPLPGVQIRIVDEQGDPVTEGDVGNLQVKGPNVFKGYWRMPEKTAVDFTADGYFNTGDKAKVGSDGYLSIVGRAKDMVITGGLNVYPKEIELIIDDLPGITESAVIGVPHPDFGEGVVAVVVAEADKAFDEITVIATLKSQLAGFKVPKRVFQVPELPRNVMGKVQKNILREHYYQVLQ